MMDAFDELGIVVMCEARWFHSTEEGKKQLTDHIPVTRAERRMRAGAISVAVKVGKVSGILKVYAQAGGA